MPDAGTESPRRFDQLLADVVRPGRLLRLGRKHRRKDALHGHDMTAGVPGAEKVTVTGPLIVLQRDRMIAGSAAEVGSDLFEGKPLWLLGVTLGFLDLADEIRMHRTPPMLRSSTEAAFSAC